MSGATRPRTCSAASSPLWRCRSSSCLAARTHLPMRPVATPGLRWSRRSPRRSKAMARAGELSAGASRRTSRAARGSRARLAHHVRAPVDLERDRLDSELAQPPVEPAKDCSSARVGRDRNLEHGALAVGDHLHLAMAPQRLIEVPRLVVVVQPDSDHKQVLRSTTRRPEYSVPLRLFLPVFSLDKRPWF